MKKYIPVDFDEKGNAVLGTQKNTPTSNGFIPTTWTPGGSDEEKQGLKSISISPAITTEPSLASIPPIYFDAEKAEEGWMHVEYNLTTATALRRGDTYTITLTPTNDWIAERTGTESSSQKGEPLVFTVQLINDGALSFGECWVRNEDESNGIGLGIEVTSN